MIGDWVELPSGLRVRGRRIGDRPADPADFLLALADGPAPPWPVRRIRWPDFRLPTDRVDALADLADALDRATETLLNEGRSPQRRLGSIDNRGSHFYLALYWAQELAQQSEDTELATAFGPIAKELVEGEETIAAELLAVQGSPVDIGGYYRPDLEKTAAVMRPSATFNRILEEISAAL